MRITLRGYLPHHLIALLEKEAFQSPYPSWSLPKEFKPITFAGGKFLESADGGVHHRCQINLKNCSSRREWSILGLVSIDGLEMEINYGVDTIQQPFVKFFNYEMKISQNGDDWEPHELIILLS